MTDRPDVTQTDGYKFSMAEAGFALRQETFYYSHRRGGYKGWHFLPSILTILSKRSPK